MHFSKGRHYILGVNNAEYSVMLWNSENDKLTALFQSLLKIPDVPRFLSENKSPDGENCEDWVEQFELVAELEGQGVVWLSSTSVRTFMGITVMCSLITRF